MRSKSLKVTTPQLKGKFTPSSFQSMKNKAAKSPRSAQNPIDSSNNDPARGAEGKETGAHKSPRGSPPVSPRTGRSLASRISPPTFNSVSKNKEELPNLIIPSDPGVGVGVVAAGLVVAGVSITSATPSEAATTETTSQPTTPSHSPRSSPPIDRFNGSQASTTMRKALTIGKISITRVRTPTSSIMSSEDSDSSSPSSSTSSSLSATSEVSKGNSEEELLRSGPLANEPDEGGEEEPEPEPEPEPELKPESVGETRIWNKSRSRSRSESDSLGDPDTIQKLSMDNQEDPPKKYNPAFLGVMNGVNGMGVVRRKSHVGRMARSHSNSESSSSSQSPGPEKGLEKCDEGEPTTRSVFTDKGKGKEKENEGLLFEAEEEGVEEGEGKKVGRQMVGLGDRAEQHAAANSSPSPKVVVSAAFGSVLPGEGVEMTEGVEGEVAVSAELELTLGEAPGVSDSRLEREASGGGGGGGGVPDGKKQKHKRHRHRSRSRSTDVVDSKILRRDPLSGRRIRTFRFTPIDPITMLGDDTDTFLNLWTVNSSGSKMTSILLSPPSSPPLPVPVPVPVSGRGSPLGNSFSPSLSLSSPVIPFASLSPSSSSSSLLSSSTLPAVEVPPPPPPPPPKTVGEVLCGEYFVGKTIDFSSVQVQDSKNCILTPETLLSSLPNPYLVVFDLSDPPRHRYGTSRSRSRGRDKDGKKKTRRSSMPSMDRTQISDSSATIVPAGTAATAGAKAEEGTGIDTNISLPRMGGVDGPDSTLPVKRLLSSPSETTDDNTPSVDYATKEDPAAYNNHSPATPRRTYEHHSLPSRINKQGKRRSISLWSTFARKKDKDSQREAATNLFPNPDGDKKEKNTGKSKENTIKCLTCGHRVPQGAKFCTECGTTMMYLLKCIPCNQTTLPKRTHCSICGTLLVPDDSHKLRKKGALPSLEGDTGLAASPSVTINISNNITHPLSPSATTTTTTITTTTTTSTALTTSSTMAGSSLVGAGGAASSSTPPGGGTTATATASTSTYGQPSSSPPGVATTSSGCSMTTPLTDPGEPTAIQVITTPTGTKTSTSTTLSTGTTKHLTPTQEAAARRAGGLDTETTESTHSAPTPQKASPTASTVSETQPTFGTGTTGYRSTTSSDESHADSLQTYLPSSVEEYAAQPQVPSPPPITTTTTSTSTSTGGVKFFESSADTKGSNDKHKSKEDRSKGKDEEVQENYHTSRSSSGSNEVDDPEESTESLSLHHEHTLNLNEALISQLNQERASISSMEDKDRALESTPRSLIRRESRMTLNLCTAMPTMEIPDASIDDTAKNKALLRYLDKKVKFIEAYHIRNADTSNASRKAELFIDLDQIGHILSNVSMDIPVPFIAYISRSVEAYNALLEETRTTSTEFQKLSYKIVEAPKADLV